MSNQPPKIKNIHAGHRQRMFEKFQNGGIKAFADHEILEILLYYTNPRKNTNPIAHALIDRFGTLAGVLEANVKDLMKVEGVGKKTAELIHFSHELFTVYFERTKKFTELLGDTNSIGEFLLSKYFGKTKEEFSILTLDGKMCYKGFHVLQSGSPDSVSVNIRDIVEVIIGDKATNIVLCHNHPGNFALPSKNDVELTYALIKTMMSIGVNVIDHMIIAGGEFVSMAHSDEYRNMFLKQYVTVPEE